MKRLMLVISVVALKVFAQSTTSTATLPLSPVDSKKVNMILGFQYSRNQQKKNDPDRSSEISYRCLKCFLNGEIKAPRFYEKLLADLSAEVI